MKLNKYLFVLMLISMSAAAYAQKKQNVYFLKNSGKEVSTKDSADYIRIIQEPDSGALNYPMIEFYANGKKRRAGSVSAFEPFLVLDGPIMLYNENGIRTGVQNYKAGALYGRSYSYFENGQLKEEADYSSSPFRKSLIFLGDSLGNVMVKDGNGHAVINIKTPDGRVQYEEGDYKDGLKEGIWKGSEGIEGSTFEETYTADKFVSGKRHINGVSYPYKIQMEAPVFKRGINDWYEYIAYTVRYPSEVRSMGIQGTVQLAYTISTDGTITDIEVVKSVDPALDKEAIRVLTSAPKWKPAKFRGLPVKIRQTIPMKFNLPR